jgi:hypothetical protein
MAVCVFDKPSNVQAIPISARSRIAYGGRTSQYSLPHCTTILLFAASLASCGGGGDSGGGGGAPLPASTFNAAATYRALLTTANTWTVSGTSINGVPIELHISTMPMTAGTFPVTGVAASRATFQGERWISGQVTDSNALVYYFNTDYSLIGVENDEGTCELPMAVFAVSSSAAPGSVGAIATINSLNGCTAASTTVGQRTIGWSIETDAGVTLFCLDAILFR